MGGAEDIGAATARVFAAAGAHVVITHGGDAPGETTKGDAAVAVLASLSGAGHSAIFAVVGDSATLSALQNFVERTYSRCDVLITITGHTKPIADGDLDTLTDDFIDEIFRLNWRGPFAAIRAFAPLLKASGNGLIVSVSSIAGMNGVGASIAYGAAKAGIDAMTQSLARALAPDVRVVSVSHGVVATGFVPDRAACADDVAVAILACATDLTVSSGTNIVIDGG